MTRASYVADTPGNSALLAGSGGLVGLAVDTEVHDVVSADGAVVDNDVPGPQGNGIPLSTEEVKVSQDVNQQVSGFRGGRITETGVLPLKAAGSQPTFLTSKRFLASLLSESPPLTTFFFSAAAPAAGASVMSTSAMVISCGATAVPCVGL